MDGSVYDSEKVPSTWIWEDMGNYYGAGANAFTVHDNMFRITFRSPTRPGEETKIIATYPKIDGIHIQNKVLSSNVKRDLAYVYGSPLDKSREIRGTIPKNRSAFTIKAAVHHPEEVLAKLLVNEMAKQGIFITGKIKFETVAKENVQNIYIQSSPLLAEIIKVINYQSINLFAEHLVRQIAYEKTGVGNREKGIEVIQKYWNAKGLPAHTIFVEDGSGLSHFNAVSPKFFTGLLIKMKDTPAFINSLPPAGKGTLYQFDNTLLPDSTFYAKSGSMTRVRCYGGYIKADNGRVLAFSIMFNHFSGSHAKLIKEIEKLFVLFKEFVDE